MFRNGEKAGCIKTLLKVWDHDCKLYTRCNIFNQSIIKSVTGSLYFSFRGLNFSHRKHSSKYKHICKIYCANDSHSCWVRRWNSWNAKGIAEYSLHPDFLISLPRLFKIMWPEIHSHMKITWKKFRILFTDIIGCKNFSYPWFRPSEE